MPASIRRRPRCPPRTQLPSTVWGPRRYVTTPRGRPIPIRDVPSDPPRARVGDGSPFRRHRQAVYEAWRSGIEGHQIRLYPHGLLLKEAEFLQEPFQDFSGISTRGTRRAFPEMRHFQKCIELGQVDGLREPTRPGVTKIPVTMEDDLQIWDSLIRERFFTRQSGHTQPLRHPNSKRYAHIDLATRSTAGVAICHLVAPRQPQGPAAKSQLVVDYDFLLALGPGLRSP
jgi:hypothetical protein